MIDWSAEEARAAKALARNKADFAARSASYKTKGSGRGNEAGHIIRPSRGGALVFDPALTDTMQTQVAAYFEAHPEAEPTKPVFKAVVTPKRRRH